MLDFLELEETVGRAWHRLAGDTRTWPRYPEAAVRLEDMLPMLSVCFRGFGGEKTVQLVPARGKTSQHRLKLRQRMGLGEEKLIHPARDEASVMLPPVSGSHAGAVAKSRPLRLAGRCHGRDAASTNDRDRSPQADLTMLDAASALEIRVLKAFPGLVDRYRRLCLAMLSERRRGSLPRVEGLLEDRIIDLLRRGAGLAPLSAGDDMRSRHPRAICQCCPCRSGLRRSSGRNGPAARRWISR